MRLEIAALFAMNNNVVLINHYVHLMKAVLVINKFLQVTKVNNAMVYAIHNTAVLINHSVQLMKAVQAINKFL